jgi:hypothetical protein
VEFDFLFEIQQNKSLVLIKGVFIVGKKDEEEAEKASFYPSN